MPDGSRVADSTLLSIDRGNDLSFRWYLAVPYSLALGHRCALYLNFGVVSRRRAPRDAAESGVCCGLRKEFHYRIKGSYVFDLKGIGIKNLRELFPIRGN